MLNLVLFSVVTLFVVSGSGLAYASHDIPVVNVALDLESPFTLVQGLAFYDDKFFMYVHDEIDNNAQIRIADMHWHGEENAANPLVDVPHIRGMVYTNGHFYMPVAGTEPENGDGTPARIHVYDTNWNRIPSMEFDLYDSSRLPDIFGEDNSSPYGITFYDSKFWVPDHLGNKVYVYDTSGNRIPSMEFNTDSLTKMERAITYSDGHFWIGSSDLLTDDSQVHVYDTNGALVPSLGFDVDDIDNIDGMTFHDGKLFVAGWSSTKDARYVNIYTINASSTSDSPDITAFENRVAALETKTTALETKTTSIENTVTAIESMISTIQTTLNRINTSITGILDRLTTLESDTPEPTPTPPPGPTPPPEPTPIIGIEGKVYNDSNNNNSLDAGESGIPNRTVLVISLADTSDVNRLTTDSNGDYSIELDAGSGWLVQVEGTHVYSYVTVQSGSPTITNLGL